MSPASAPDQREPRKKLRLLDYLPGLALASLLAAVCTWAAGSGGRALFAMPTSPVSPVLLAVLAGALLGMLVRWPAALLPGLQLAVTCVLRTGIALIGLRLALGSLGALSLRALPVVAGCLLVAALVIPRICRGFGVGRESALLLTVGTAICGCTAVLAIAPIIRATAAQTGYAVATVMLLGLCGVVAYPFLAHHLFAAAPIAAGIFLGTAIHDTSQVVGAGLLYSQQFHSPQALAAATVAKLLRNLSLAAVVPIVAWRAARAHALAHAQAHALEQAPAQAHSGRQEGLYLPWFVLGFIACVAARTLGDALCAGHATWQPGWTAALAHAAHAADWCLTIGMSAAGMTLSREGISALGFRPLLAGLLAAAVVAATSLSLLLVLY